MHLELSPQKNSAAAGICEALRIRVDGGVSVVNIHSNEEADSDVVITVVAKDNRRKIIVTTLENGISFHMEKRFYSGEIITTKLYPKTAEFPDGRVERTLETLSASDDSGSGTPNQLSIFKVQLEIMDAEARDLHQRIELVAVDSANLIQAQTPQTKKPSLRLPSDVHFARITRGLNL